MGRFFRFTFSESGHEIVARYTRKTVDGVLRPLADTIAGEFEMRNRERYLVGVAGPPGSGKSTLSALLRHLLNEKGLASVVLPLDGFHMRNEELKSTWIRVGDDLLSLYERKGAKESYDTDRLTLCMNKLSRPEPFHWPLYSRKLHEPVEEGVRIDRWSCICIIEGNYLCLNEAPWEGIRRLFHKSIFIRAKESLLKERIIKRKVRGGFSRDEAEAHYRRSDALNIEEVTRKSGGYDVLLLQKGKHGYRLLKSGER